MDYSINHPWLLALKLYISLLIIIALIPILIFIRLGSPRDVNVYFDDKVILKKYFDDSVILGMEENIANIEAINILVIHSGMLDEALVSLSTEPIVYASLLPALRALVYPKLNWRLPARPAGVYFSPPELIKTTIKQLSQYIKSIFTLVFTPVLYPTRYFLLKYLSQILLRTVASAGYGLPPRNSREAIFLLNQVWICRMSFSGGTRQRNCRGGGTKAFDILHK